MSTKPHVSAVESFAAPPRDWLPLPQARFHFFPYYVAPGQAWTIETIALLRRFAPPTAIMRSPDERSTVLIEIGAVCARIDAEAGQIGLEPLDEDDESAAYLFMRKIDDFDDPTAADPDAFFAAVADRTLRPEFQDDGTALIEVLQAYWSALSARFLYSVEKGAAEVFGRWRSIDAPLTIVAADQWMLLRARFDEIEVHDTGDYRLVAHLKRGDVQVFGPHVRAGTALSPVEKATAALVAEMRDAASPRNRDEVWLEYAKRFKLKRTTVRDVVWPEANSRAGAFAWNKPGRRPDVNRTAKSIASPEDKMSPYTKPLKAL